MNQRFLDALVAVDVVGVLADDGDADALVRVGDALDELLPAREIRRRGVEAELLDDALVEALLVEPERDLVDRADVRTLDHGAEFDVAEEGDLPFDVVGDRPLGAAA